MKPLRYLLPQPLGLVNVGSLVYVRQELPVRSQPLRYILPQPLGLVNVGPLIYVRQELPLLASSM
jgi:hypothetical protein